MRIDWRDPDQKYISLEFLLYTIPELVSGPDERGVITILDEKWCIVGWYEPMKMMVTERM